jgi:hypothetical protein
LNQKIKHFRSDRCGEYFSNEFDLFYAEHGIYIREGAALFTSIKWVAEIKNRTLIDLVNSMLDTAGLSKAWWGRLY